MTRGHHIKFEGLNVHRIEFTDVEHLLKSPNTSSEGIDVFSSPLLAEKRSEQIGTESRIPESSSRNECAKDGGVKCSCRIKSCPGALKDLDMLWVIRVKWRRGEFVCQWVATVVACTN